MTIMQSDPFLQSKHWAAAQRALGAEVYERSGEGWSYLAIVERRAGTSRIYTPLGPVAESVEKLEAALADLTELARARRALSVRVEPTVPAEVAEVVSLLRARGGAEITPVQPEWTQFNDLTGTNEELLSAYSSTAVRNWKHALKKGISVRHSTDPADIEIFLNHLRDVKLRTGMRPHSDSYFRTLAATLIPEGAGGILIADFEAEPVGTIFYYKHQGLIMYAHGATLTTTRGINPSYPLLVELLLQGKQWGGQVLDMCGIAPEGAGRDHPWAGFTEFKRRFRGTVVQRPGTWEIVLRPVPHKLFNLANSSRKKLTELVGRVRAGRGKSKD